MRQAIEKRIQASEDTIRDIFKDVFARLAALESAEELRERFVIHTSARLTDIERCAILGRKRISELERNEKKSSDENWRRISSSHIELLSGLLDTAILMFSMNNCTESMPFTKKDDDETHLGHLVRVAETYKEYL